MANKQIRVTLIRVPAAQLAAALGAFFFLKRGSI